MGKSTTKTEGSTKYVDLISRDEATIQKDELSLHVETAELQVKADLIQARRMENMAKSTLNNVISMIPFNPKNYINAKRDLADAQDLIKELEEILVELF